MAASLPDWTVTPWIRSLTVTMDRSGANMAELPDGAPPVRHACSRDLELVLELEPPGLQLAKHDGERHELAHARRHHLRIGVLLEQHEIGVGIHQDGVLALVSKPSSFDAAGVLTAMAGRAEIRTAQATATSHQSTRSVHGRTGSERGFKRR